MNFVILSPKKLLMRCLVDKTLVNHPISAKKMESALDELIAEKTN